MKTFYGDDPPENKDTSAASNPETGMPGKVGGAGTEKSPTTSVPYDFHAHVTLAQKIGSAPVQAEAAPEPNRTNPESRARHVPDAFQSKEVPPSGSRAEALARVQTFQEFIDWVEDTPREEEVPRNGRARADAKSPTENRTRTHSLRPQNPTRQAEVATTPPPRATQTPIAMDVHSGHVPAPKQEVRIADADVTSEIPVEGGGLGASGAINPAAPRCWDNKGVRRLSDGVRYREVKCAGICEKEVAGKAYWLTNGERLCQECHSLFDSFAYSIYAKYPIEPRKPWPPKSPHRSSAGYWAVFGGLFLPTLILSAFAVGMVESTDGASLGVGVIVFVCLWSVAIFLARKSVREDYQRRMEKWRSEEPALQAKYQTKRQVYEQELTEHKAFLEKRDRVRKAYQHCCNFWPGYPPDWDERRSAIRHRDGDVCTKCGEKGNTLFPLHVHHKRKLSAGGTNEESNLVTLCERCHAREDGHEHMLQELEWKEAIDAQINSA